MLLKGRKLQNPKAIFSRLLETFLFTNLEAMYFSPYLLFPGSEKMKFDFCKDMQLRKKLKN